MTPVALQRLFAAGAPRSANGSLAQALQHPLHIVFWVMIAIAAAVLAAALLVPKRAGEQAAVPGEH